MPGFSRRGVTRPQTGLAGFWLSGLHRRLSCLSIWLTACSERARQRRVLASLPDHGLRDIGLTRADVESEVAKPCWRR